MKIAEKSAWKTSVSITEKVKPIKMEVKK